ncbi:diguanylate cyclase [Campylobacter majalis]|uniref:diguanylate cyclase n=1 Tax=Campylobacter majalis TaxID=2790656 RepID=UPI003D68BBF3
MDKILIVDDNKALSKLLAKKMEKEVLDMQTDVAYTYAEARSLIDGSKDKYFLAVLDLNLPDAPNGEIVDYAISKGIGVIVLTGSIDKATKEQFTQKDIIDYVYKGNVNEVNYIFSMINRLSKNRQYKVMVVEDSTPVRNSIKKILQNLQFQVFAAAHGEEAMNYFYDNPDMKLILTDYNMPVKNGLELLHEVREHADKNRLGVIAMTSPNADVGTAMFLKHGANDFIAKPFEREEIVCRVNNTIDAIENIEKIGNFVNCDFLTGAYNRRYFFNNIQEYCEKIQDSDENFALAMLDIDHFKKINDTYGHDGGDCVLKFLSSKLTQSVKECDIVSRFGGEEFCIALKDVVKEEAVRFFVNLRAAIAESVVSIKGESVKITVSIGVAFYDREYSIKEIIDIADEALYQAKENGRNRVEIANV